MKRGIPWLTTLTLGVLLIVLLFEPDHPSVASPVANPEPSTQVVVGTVARVPIEQTVRLGGTTRAAKTVRLSFTIGGRLEERPVEIADPVKKGDLLARLDVQGYVNQRARATAVLSEIDARLAQLTRDENRVRSLVSARAAAPEELERVESGNHALVAQRAAAVAGLSETRRLVREATLRAPFDGKVVYIGLEPGEFAAPGVPVLTIVSDGDLELEVEAPERLLPALSEDAQVEVLLPMIERKATGRIDSIGTAALGAKLFPVVVKIASAGKRSAELPSMELMPGLTAEVVVQASRPQLSVPVAALVNPGAGPAVFRLRGGRAERVDVEVTKLSGDRAVIRGPLSPGDKVIIAGHTSLASGDSVEEAS